MANPTLLSSFLPRSHFWTQILKLYFNEVVLHVHGLFLRVQSKRVLLLSSSCCVDANPWRCQARLSLIGEGSGGNCCSDSDSDTFIPDASREARARAQTVQETTINQDEQSRPERRTRTPRTRAHQRTSYMREVLIYSALWRRFNYYNQRGPIIAARRVCSC